MALLFSSLTLIALNYFILIPNNCQILGHLPNMYSEFNLPWCGDHFTLKFYGYLYSLPMVLFIWYVVKHALQWTSIFLDQLNIAIPAKLVLKEYWWNHSISLSANICGLCWWGHYLFLLGSRLLFHYHKKLPVTQLIYTHPWEGCSWSDFGVLFQNSYDVTKF